MSKGRFGIHGGQYIPETLMNAVLELEEAYNHYKDDPEFNRELTELLNNYAGRPSRLYYAADWLRTVASAAPFTPMPRTKIKIGSRMILITAPMTVVIILILAKP